MKNFQVKKKKKKNHTKHHFKNHAHLPLIQTKKKERVSLQHHIPFQHTKPTSNNSNTMGKRKSSTRKPAKKIKQTLDVQFTCLFCNHEKSVICTLDKKNLLGELHCKICGQNFQTAIHGLSQPVDVYSDWIDACEDLAEEAEKNGYEGDDHDRDDVYSDDDDDHNVDRRGREVDPVLGSDGEEDDF